MSSSEGAKWFVVILIYFAVMTFIVSLIGFVSDTTIGTSSNSTGTYCGSPRNIYEAYEGTPKDLSDVGWVWKNYYEAHIDCSLSAGILGQANCESLSGCEWDTPTFLWWATGDATCIGEMNYTFMNSTQQIGLLGTGIADFVNPQGEDSKFICEHPSVRNNKTLCEDLSCTWKYRSGLDTFDGQVIEPKLSMLGTMWDTAKDMVTFRFDFGFDNTLLNTMLYFLIFWLPLIALGLSLYVMVRS